MANECDMLKEVDPSLKRWANTGPNGEMEEHPHGEFVLLGDIKTRRQELSCPTCGTPDRIWKLFQEIYL